MGKTSSIRNICVVFSWSRYQWRERAARKKLIRQYFCCMPKLGGFRNKSLTKTRASLIHNGFKLSNYVKLQMTEVGNNLVILRFKEFDNFDFLVKTGFLCVMCLFQMRKFLLNI